MDEVQTLQIATSGWIEPRVLEKVIGRRCLWGAVFLRAG
jgi:hypothetical protein